MRRTRIAVALLAPLVFAAGCASVDNDALDFAQEWSTWHEEAVRPPVKSDLREVVRDPRRWHDLWNGMPPEVDFSKKMVLVAETRVVEHPKDMPRIWQIRRVDGKPGFIVLVRVRQVGGNFENKLAGGPGFHFVVVDKEDGPVKWKDVCVVYDAGGDVDELEPVKEYE